MRHDEPFHLPQPSGDDLERAWRWIRPLDCTAPLAEQPPVQQRIARMAAISLLRERDKGPPPPPRDAQLVRHAIARRLGRPRPTPAVRQRRAADVTPAALSLELFDPLEVT